MVFVLFSLICVGLLGGSLFTTGIIFSITPLVAAGIALLVLSIFSMLVYYIYCQQATVQSHSQGTAAYTTNNMNTMNRTALAPSAFSTKRNPNIAENNIMLTPSAFSTKRNKSDTDLELIGRRAEEV